MLKSIGILFLNSMEYSDAMHMYELSKSKKKCVLKFSININISFSVLFLYETSIHYVEVHTYFTIKLLFETFLELIGRKTNFSRNVNYAEEV